MAGVWHGMCELTAWHGRGMAWAQQAMCELALTSLVTGKNQRHLPVVLGSSVPE